jgi:hypothetical protein
MSLSSRNEVKCTAIRLHFCPLHILLYSSVYGVGLFTGEVYLRKKVVLCSLKLALVKKKSPTLSIFCQI